MLREQLPDQAAARRSQGKADADLPLPGHGAREHHIRNICAGNQQNEREGDQNRGER